MGRGLAACIQEVLSGLQSLFEGDLYADLNGEQWRAHEWGCVRVHLGARLGAPRLHLSGTEVGDVGLSVARWESALRRTTSREAMADSPMCL